VQQQSIAVVVGTRPEAIKLAPVVLALRRHSRFRTVLISTGQHTDLLDQALGGFGLTPDIELGLRRPEGGLTEFLGVALEPIARTLRGLQPTLTLVQGDTMTSSASRSVTWRAGSGPTTSTIPSRKNRSAGWWGCWPPSTSRPRRRPIGT
jgi:UDP-N-acetylglucosamine 2-epimerase (non-hydrolysing)